MSIFCTSFVGMSMENRKRSLPGWLTNLGDEKPSTKKKRQGSNSNETNSCKKTVKGVSNGMANVKGHSSESIPVSLKNVDPLACDSSRSNASPKKCAPFSVSSSGSEDESTRETMIANPLESSHCDVTENDVLAKQSNDACPDDSEPHSPSLFDKVSSPSVGSSAINEDSDQPDTSAGTMTGTQVSNNSHRRICKYGDKCFRRNSQHLQDFVHPGDKDFSSVDNRPECEYGLSCYRKNPLHRQHYKHTKNVRKPRKAKCPQSTSNDNSASDEDNDYDLDDPFLNDGSSDDYEPEGSDSETDFSDAVGSEEDVTQLQKETKGPKQKRRH